MPHTFTPGMTILTHTIEGYPSPSGPVMLVRVLTEDAVSQVAAYVAVLTDAGREPAPADLEWIARHGSKLTEREAGKHFSIDQYTYRR